MTGRPNSNLRGVSKLLLVGDSHGDGPFMKAAMELGAELEVAAVVQLGDFGFWPGSDFAEKRDNQAQALGLPLWVIDGNHDSPAHYAPFRGAPSLIPGLTHVPRGTIARLNGRYVGFLGGAVSIDSDRRIPGRSWWPEEVLTQAEVDTALQSQRDRRLIQLDVALTHDAPIPPIYTPWKHSPFVTRQLARQTFFFDQVLSGWKPKLHVHGHWHVQYSCATEYGVRHGLAAQRLSDSTRVLYLDELEMA